MVPSSASCKIKRHVKDLASSITEHVQRNLTAANIRFIDQNKNFSNMAAGGQDTFLGLFSDEEIPPSQPPDASFMLTGIRAENQDSEDSGDEPSFGQCLGFISLFHTKDLGHFWLGYIRMLGHLQPSAH